MRHAWQRLRPASCLLESKSCREVTVSQKKPPLCTQQACSCSQDTSLTKEYQIAVYVSHMQGKPRAPLCGPLQTYMSIGGYLLDPADLSLGHRRRALSSDRRAHPTKTRNFIQSIKKARLAVSNWFAAAPAPCGRTHPGAACGMEGTPPESPSKALSPAPGQLILHSPPLDLWLARIGCLQLPAGSVGECKSP